MDFPGQGVASGKLLKSSASQERGEESSLDGNKMYRGMEGMRQYDKNTACRRIVKWDRGRGHSQVMKGLR